MPESSSDERVLIIAPVGQDAPAMGALLKAQNFQAQVCASPGECAQRIAEGAGALVLTEEALELPLASDLLETIQAQPPWSELPLIVLTSGGESRTAKLLEVAATAAGALTLLERPMSAATLWRSVQVALASRRRQYQVRALIEEQQRRERQLLEQARLLDLSNDAILVRGPDDRITYWNRGAIEAYGYSSEEALGKIAHDLLRTEFPVPLALITEELHRDGRWRGELIHTRKNGASITVASRWALDRDARGGPGSILETNNDITERKRADEVKGRLAAIVEHSHDAIVGKDLDGIIRSWNRGAELLFGYTASEAIGQPVTMLIPRERLDEEPGILKRIRHGEVVDHYETVRRRKDGKLLDISLTVSPVRDAHGRIVGASKVARDITERKQSEQALLQSEVRYRSLVSQVKDYAIFHMDLAGLATSWNEGVKRILGFDEKEFVGTDISTSIFTPEDIEAGVPQRELQTAAVKGTAGNDRWLRRKDGSRFFASGITTALRDASGTVTGFSKVLRDVTEKKEAEERLERTVEERTADLRATNEQLEAFVYSIAHDLRAPLRSMTGYSQLLVDGHASNLDETAQQMLKRIQASSEFMDKLLVDLLAYGRTARAELELGPVEVQKAWESALLQCALQIEQSKAQVETLQPLPKVRAHEATLGQCLANLLANGLKFVAPGVQPRVTLRAEEEPHSVRLWVEDNGIGIPANQHERIFRVFERLHGARYMGTGIGLSIVRKGIERMGGRVGLESEPGKGARFWIELPRARGAAD